MCMMVPMPHLLAIAITSPGPLTRSEAHQIGEEAVASLGRAGHESVELVGFHAAEIEHGEIELALAPPATPETIDPDLPRFGPTDGPALVTGGIPLVKKPNPVYMVQ